MCGVANKSYDSSDEVERAPATFASPRYSEDAPADRDFYRDDKSGVLHSCESGKKVSLCKVAINSNYKIARRTI